MKVFLNTFKWLMVVITIEYLFYIKMKPKDMELFYFVWGFIYMAMLLCNVFNVDSSGIFLTASYSEVDGTNKAILDGILLEKDLNSNVDNRTKYRYLLDSLSLAYFIAILLNIVGYCLVM